MLPDFTTPDDFRALLAAAPSPDGAATEAARSRNGQLTKPPGALGRLEDLAIWYAGWRDDPRPSIMAPQVIVFAGNHGVAARGVSAFPAEVTVQMVANFRAGGAAINQLAGAAGARMDVHALDLDRPTADFTRGPAMDERDLMVALRTGWKAVDSQADLLVVGEMGIANTTAAAAICLALFGGEAADWTGRGTGVDDDGLLQKRSVVADAVERHGAHTDGLAVLARLGGREIAAMAGAIAAARQLRIPVLLDGFICCAAAACLQALDARALDHCLAGHQSAESAHAELLRHLGKEPLLSLGLRLGEGSGGALAINILKAAVACHSGMATFAEAGVAGDD
ncbi:nicotinate-nucleotide--dimethylbenzimidazole phosphoribosyltransferase [Pukyongiella litopenaei]|uniref:Nicotinate-nucleotide--dimethylbenzimidazole phosphoribosyltransferase n=1 Tax=Pukyongiella litopenaei TaxID=2605946 RepID=A0A2S0MKR3_9RHOB|nr:nicotinate-nucleotide--dimethylbenzimidazole phosphoribosyltransferase [Pukyongiella litopenaei]AVO36417.1 nicotinate-nucleotide--dimethylbenzimidazole phosphoribosyltransferase [Pukyongiella litopenaei]